MCKFLVLSNLALKLLLLLSGFIFSFFVGRFCPTAMLYFIMGFFLPKSSGVKLQESIVDDCPSILNRNQVTATSSCDMESSYTLPAFQSCQCISGDNTTPLPCNSRQYSVGKFSKLSYVKPVKSSLRWSSGLNPCSVREESISKSNLLLISSHMFCLEMYIQTGMGSSYTYQLAFFTQLIFSVSCNNCRASSLFSDYIVLYCMDVYKYKLTC